MGRAGPGALHAIRQHGFSAELVGTMAGASGGAKWLVLSKLDRVVAATLVPRLRGPVYLVGSSIGAWRFACYAQAEPVKAIERFEEAREWFQTGLQLRPGDAKTLTNLGAALDQLGCERLDDVRGGQTGRDPEGGIRAKSRKNWPSLPAMIARFTVPKFQPLSSAFRPLIIRAAAPQVCGEAMLVPL